MSTLLPTQKRRAMQVLLSKLDQHVGPFVGQGLVLAVSGGPDSRALLESMARWRQRLNATILVLCLDHGVRSQSSSEARITTMRARRLGFAAKLVTLLSDAHLGEQELREKRYQALTRACDSIGTKYICTAHHQDDNAEGYLMALLGIGGGSRGAAMGVCEPWGEYQVLRPFVGLKKNDLLLALSLHHYTDFAVDNLDQDRAGQRAWVRHEVLPQLLSHGSNIAQRLDYFGQLERQNRIILTRLAQSLITWSEDQAVINVMHRPEPLLIELAVQAVLKKWCKNRDLRQSGPTLSKLAGLDRSSKRINVKHLDAKEFVLPGAVAYSNSEEIIIKRV